MAKIRVLVVEDHAIVRQGIRLLLDVQPDMEVAGEAADGREAIEAAGRLLPDVVVMDLAMPGLNGLEATRAIRKRFPNVQVVALTVHESEDYFFQMITAGAAGYVLKGADPSQLLEAIRTAHQGEVFLHPPLTTKLVRDYLRRVGEGEVTESYGLLTEREREVLRLLAEGHTNQEIADILTIGPSTVQTHRAHIMEKLRLRKRSELMNYAIRQGLLDLRP
ncbi:MAG: response regulator transcription factor [Chloroflexota bacterium]|nr:response regulator transcription factor [Chloroflexota bacterium]